MGVQIKRGDTVRVEIIKIEETGITVFVKEKQKEVFVPNEELKQDFLKKLKKESYVNEKIYLRIKSLRPLALSGKRVNQDKVLFQSKNFEDKPKKQDKKKNKEEKAGENDIFLITFFIALIVFVIIELLK